jgi:hypothetical protein
MWTDINTKPKQGADFRAFRGHVMGIPADYNDTSFATRCNFRPPNWIPEQVLMLPIPRDWVASQECVGEQVTNKEVEIWDQSPTKDRRVRFAVDEEVREPTAESIKQDRRAPIKIVGIRAWSPGIYQALRLLGKSLDVAWEKAFIHPLTFN